MENTKIKVPTFKNLETFADQVALKYAAKTEVPTKVSDLTNDSGFQTAEQVAAAVAAADEKLTGYLKTSDIEEITEAEIIALFNK